MINNLLSFIFGAICYCFIAEKQWWCVVLILILEGFNVYTKEKREDHSLRDKLVVKAAYIYTIVNDPELSEGMSPPVKKEISKIAAEIPPMVGGLDIIQIWISSCVAFRKELKERRNKNANK